MINFPQFTIQQVKQSFANRPQLQMKNITALQKKEGVELSANADGILQSSFIMGIIGNPGAGKSSIIQQFLLNGQFYGNKFERVLFIGPTIYTKLVQDSYNTAKQLDLQWIYAQIQQCNSWKCKSLLIILDDVVSSMKSYTNPDFVDLFYNRRHLLKQGVISFVVTSQKWNMVPTFIRTAYNMVIIFALAKQQQQTIGRQLNISLPKKVFMHLMGGLKKFQFIYLNCQTGKIFNQQWQEL